MRTNVRYLKVLVFVIFFLMLPNEVLRANILTACDASRLEVKSFGRTYSFPLADVVGGKISLPKNAQRQTVKSAAASERQTIRPKHSKAYEMLKPLRIRLISAKKDINSILKLAKARHQEERKDSVDDFEVDVARKRVEIAQRILAGVRQGVIRASEAVELSSSDGRKRSIVVEATRQTAPIVLSDAIAALEEAQQPPNELLERQRQELREYSELGVLHAGSQRELRGAEEVIGLVLDKPDLLEKEMVKCEKVVTNFIKKIYATLIKEQGAATKPISFSTKQRAYGYIRLPRGKKNFVLVTRVYPNLFVPSDEEYLELQKQYSQLPSYSSKSQVIVLDSIRFRLILKDGRRLFAERFVDPKNWGGTVVVNSGRRCVIQYKRNPPRYMNIRIGWFLEEQDCTPPLKLQFDNFRPVSVPDKYLERRSSRRLSPRSPFRRRSSQQQRTSRR